MGGGELAVGDSTGESEALAEAAGDEFGAGDAEALGLLISFAKQLAFDGDANFFRAESDARAAEEAGLGMQFTVI